MEECLGIGLSGSLNAAARERNAFVHEHILIGIEDMEPNHWIAWVLAIPGCYASAHTRAQAIDGIPAALHAETGRTPTGRIVVAEEWRAIPAPGDPKRLINACFATDREPLTRDDIDTGIRRLRDTRRGLLRLIELDEAWRDEQIQPILAHVARAETRYLTAMGWSVDVAALPSATVARLGAVRDQLAAALVEWEGSTAVASTSGEEWTSRKVLRRSIWHERDHTQQIASILAPSR